MRCAFLVNARASTTSADFYTQSRAGGYLFPPDRNTRPLTANLAASRKFILSDNGAFDAIGRLAQQHSSADQQTMVDAIRTAVADVDTTAQLAAQLGVRPDSIIGIEDLTLATWLRAGVDERELQKLRRELRRRNTTTARRGLEHATRLTPLQVLTVASAHDYDTARDAAIAFAGNGVRAVAMGFGAFMADDQWVTTIKTNGKTRRLPRSLPYRYLRTALVARGFFDGWTSTGTPPPDRFHFLGLGAPIMLPLAALAARRCAHVTFDATSPIKDATEATLYVTKPASLKVRTWKIAESLARSNTLTWDCPCGFCRTFTAQHPFDLDRLRRQHPRHGTAYSTADLRNGGRLANLTPLFRTGPGPAARQAEAARIGHNHWTLGTLTQQLTRHATTARDLGDFVQQHVSRYEANAGADHFADSVRLAHQIVRPDSEWW